MNDIEEFLTTWTDAERTLDPAALDGLLTDDFLGVGPFVVLPIAHGLSLDFVDTTDFDEHHDAFLVDDAEFEPIFERIQAAGAAFRPVPAPAGRDQSPLRRPRRLLRRPRPPPHGGHHPALPPKAE